ncbi:MAG: phosphoenolpyruvate--protein phosphotransferase [Thermoanaerobaculaceae bacterium]|nr:phosphoenolpyruvate--protein phosphotransferase [Thermoanaerobaculaceae bacterium]MDI9621730.1 phosphoenolpyruvate--protein phosphotransferase [Acidobacteriota bacterium]NLH12214.1 phosphoenolpyruvate--protein phosphotransferase [Holophagae bacterium]HPW56031.1 phosphoenolpyruvate--protein phosphotransferase [Thermoanaerobaculaceae bacterium]
MSYSRMLVGLGVSPGIAIGPPLVVENRPQPVLRLFLSPDRVEAEVQRLHEAAARAAMALSDLAAQARTTVGHEYASIFEAHRLMAEDPTLLSQVEERIRRESANAEWALQEVIQVMLGQFEGLGDVYLRERRTDLLDVAAQLQRALQGRASPRLGEAPDGAILVADDIPPSQAIQLSSGSVGGFVSEAGGITSHTTIIAKSLGIPAVVGVAQVVPAMERAAMVIVDGFEGHVIVDPEPALVQVYRLRAEEYQQRQRELLATAHLPATTVDGRPVELLANIDLLHEIPAAKAGGAGGVGLFRSEFLFMQASPVLPDEDQQVEAYSQLLEAFPGQPVTVRTYDLGGKKLARELLGNPEDNPVLGLRGVRLCLRKPEFFRTQLRALLRAASRGQGLLRIMVPLIGHVEEVKTVRVLLARYGEELRAEGHPLPDRLQVGVMIEVPSAALIAKHLAKEVDFFAIGTNDLTQYTLAVDRANEYVSELYRPFHPAVLRLIHRVIAVAHDAQITVSLCGEMAADPLAVPVLVGMGLREFSLHPAALPVVRRLVRALSFREARRIANRALELATAKEVEEYLLEQLSALLAHVKVRIRL